jgi:myo-inositol-1(or 4)-monophosphatase
MDSVGWNGNPPICQRASTSYNRPQRQHSPVEKIAVAKYIEVCERAVRAAGATILDLSGRVGVWEKGPADLVTEADLASQEVVRRIVLGAFPEHCLLGEEDAGGEASPPRADYRWIVDPIDGTTNYVHGVPHFSVSLALEHQGKVLVGAVYDPNRDECFTAISEEGAWLNGRPIHTSQVSDLGKAVAAVGFPAGVGPDSLDLCVFQAAVFQCQSMRRTGCASLNLCYLAAGRFDVFWSFSTKIWDVAAGALLIHEAGGVITSPDGGTFVLDDGRFLAAANRPLHAQLQRLTAAALRPAR